MTVIADIKIFSRRNHSGLYKKTSSNRTHKDNKSCYRKSYHKTATYSSRFKKKRRKVFAKELGNGDLISKARALTNTRRLKVFEIRRRNATPRCRTGECGGKQAIRGGVERT